MYRMRDVKLCLQNVYGEIYYIDDKFLAHLDDFEGHPYFYQRDIITIRVVSRAEHEGGTAANGIAKDSQEIMNCSVYMQKNFDPSMLDRETYASYDSAGAHGRPYRPE